MGNGLPTVQQVANSPAVAPVLAAMPADQRTDLAKRIHSTVVHHLKRGRGGGGGTRTHAAEQGMQRMARTRLWNNYYSIVRFQAVVTVAPPVTTLTFAVQELRPFSYRINDPLTSAGFDPTVGNATECDTNLVKAGETIAGELVKVHGLSLMNSDITDIELWKQLVSQISVVISMNGDAQRYRLGRIPMIPGSGGTFGSALTTVITPPLNASLQATPAFSNGWPTVDNYYPFPLPMIWSPSGETDSNFNIVLRQQRQVVILETARAPAAGVAGFTPPTVAGQFGTFIDVMARLHAEQISPRSVNQ